MRLAIAVAVASLLFVACGGSDGANVDDDSADEGGGKPAASCDECTAALDHCLDQEAEDGAEVNRCFGTYASCVFDTTGRAIGCPEGADCSECFEDCHEQTLSRECAVTQSGCILVGLNLGRDAAVCPAPLPRTCEDCQAQLEACDAEAEDGFEINQCLGQFARCYFDTVGDSVDCPEGVDCSECDEDCHEEQVSQDCAVRRSECILVGLGLDVAATRCPVTGN